MGHEPAMLIYKILRRPEWDAFRAAGETAGAPVDLADGFIHFSTAAQVAETAAKWFATESDLVLVAFDADALGEALSFIPHVAIDSPLAGETPVVLYDAAKKLGKGVPKEYYIAVTDAFLAAAEDRFGKESVKLK